MPQAVIDCFHSIHINHHDAHREKAPAALQPLDTSNHGLRLCLGAAPTEAELERVLRVLRNILENAEELSIV